MITGILPLDKPLGWTSHDAVARVRRLAGQKQVGHAGTLDPLATGVLLLVLGGATRLSPYLMGTEKEYCAEVVLGVTTATDDAEAPVLEQRDISSVTREQIERALARFGGDIDQVPPRYAAVKRGGERLYVLARRGEEIELIPRRVRIETVELERWQPPRLRLRVRCGPGTYIRALARDIGEALGVGAYLHALRRIRSGTFDLGDCVPLDDLGDREAVLRHILPPDRALTSWPAVVLDEVEADMVGNGQTIAGAAPAPVRMYAPTGELLALGEPAQDGIKPFRVFGRGADATGQ